MKAAVAMLAMGLAALLGGCLLDCPVKTARVATFQAPGLYQLTVNGTLEQDWRNPEPLLHGVARVPVGDAYVKELAWHPDPNETDAFRFQPPAPPFAAGNLTGNVWILRGANPAWEPQALQFLQDLVPANHTGLAPVAATLAKTGRAVLDGPYDLPRLVAKQGMTGPLVENGEVWDDDGSKTWSQESGAWTLWWNVRVHTLESHAPDLGTRLRVDAWDNVTAEVSSQKGVEVSPTEFQSSVEELAATVGATVPDVGAASQDVCRVD